MVGLWVHCPLAATIVSVGARTLVLETPFLVTLVPSSCFWDATICVSYEVGLGELAFLWLLVNLSETWTAGPDKLVVTVFLVFCPEGSAKGPVLVRPDRTWNRTGNLPSRQPALVPVLIFQKFTSQPSSWHIFTRSWVWWRQTWWDLALTNQSSRYWWIFISLCMAISFHFFVTTVNSMGAVDRPKGRALNWYVRPWTWNLWYFLNCSCIDIWK